MKPKKIKLYKFYYNLTSSCWAVGYRGRSASWKLSKIMPRKEWTFIKSPGITLTTRAPGSASWSKSWQMTRSPIKRF